MRAVLGDEIRSRFQYDPVEAEPDWVVRHAADILREADPRHSNTDL